MKERIEELFWNLGKRLEERDAAQPFYYELSFFDSPAIYKAQNVHAFYQGIWNPTKVIYVVGDTEQSTESELCVRAKLIEDTDRCSLGERIRALQTFKPGTMELEFQDLSKWDASKDVVNAKIPYDSALLENEIFSKIPQRALK